MNCKENRGLGLYFFCQPPLSKTGVIITGKKVPTMHHVRDVAIFDVLPKK